jgi:hypothetical protein
VLRSHLHRDILAGGRFHPEATHHAERPRDAPVEAFIVNFRRKDHHGGAKAGWTLLIIILPLLGTLIYLIARPAIVE